MLYTIASRYMWRPARRKKNDMAGTASTRARGNATGVKNLVLSCRHHPLVLWETARYITTTPSLKGEFIGLLSL